MSEAYIGRQPIYDRNLNIHAYELLYRTGEVNGAQVANGDQATSTVVMNALLDIGLENLIGEHRAFINFTHWFLTNADKIELPTE
ncbi:MAG: diguanylate phosphodiesterase, partial [Anaerolineae bacterium]|nr:diguanylate phosphodiesterase [Anaerolineae bacterium]